MMARSRRSALLAGLVALSLLAGACSSDGKAEPEPRTEPRVVPGFDGGEIQVGLLVPGSGPLADVAVERALGLRAYFDYATTELAGVGAKYPIRVAVRDSSDPEQVEAAYEDLRDGTVVLAQVEGQGVLERLQPAIEEDDVLVGLTGGPAAWARSANVLSIGVPTELQAANALSWALDGNGGDHDRGQACLAVQDGFDTAAWQDGARRAAAEMEVTLPAPVVLPRTATAASGLRPAVDRLRGAGCDAVLLDASSAATAAAIGAASAAGFAPSWVIPATGASTLLGDESLAEYAAANVTTVGDGPTSVAPTGLPSLTHLRDLFAPNHPLTPAFISGVLLGKAIVAVLDDGVNRLDLSRPAILADAALRRTVSFDQLAPDPSYGDPARRRPPTRSTISQPDPEHPTGLRPIEPGFSAPFTDDVLADLLAR